MIEDFVAPKLSDDARRRVVEIARRTIESYLRTGDAPPVETGGLRELEDAGAAFVTLRRRDGELRGCIGTVAPQRPLAEAVRDLAISAATRDRRFDSVTAEELDEIHIEVSVLSPVSAANLDRIEVGLHGLIVRRGAASGVLLPQVASERGWDREMFLRQTCRKAGLPEDAWRDPATQILWFACDVIEEPD